MARWEIILVLLSAIGFCLSSTDATESDDAHQKPHIVFILADDLGWNDISWNNPVVLSPNLEKLAREGVLLEQSYVQPICTPTRSALMTGRYPYTLGRQHGVIKPKVPTGVSIKRKLLPEAMKAAGYSTHIVGKWHLGFCSWDYTPTSRGFDTFWGYYTGSEDYYYHTRAAEDVECPEGLSSHAGATKTQGYDFRNNTEVEYSVRGDYSTYAFTSYTVDLLESRNPEEPMFLYLPFQSVHGPLQVPDNYIKPFKRIKDRDRRVKLGMVSALDEAVGTIVEALKTSGHYNNTIIIFSTDNGGPISVAGNNWPLRGNKATLWEGGTRGPAFVHSPLLSRKGVVSNDLIHVTDWFPTIAALGGGVAPEDTHGYDQWATISTGAPSPRVEMVYNIDTTTELKAGLRMGNYKMLLGDPGEGDWTPPPEGFNATQDQEHDSRQRHEEEEGEEEGRGGKGIPSDETTEAYKSLHDRTTAEIDDPGKEDRITEDPRQDGPRKDDPRKDDSRKADPIKEDKEGRRKETPRKEEIFRPRKNHKGPFVVVAGVNGIDSSEKKTTEENETITNDDEKTDPPREHPETEKDSAEGISPEKGWRGVDDGLTLGELKLNISQFRTLEHFLTANTTVRLYHVMDDPEERTNVAKSRKEVVQILLAILQHYMKDYVKADIPPENPAGGPQHWGDAWSPGWCRAK